MRVEGAGHLWESRALLCKQEGGGEIDGYPLYQSARTVLPEGRQWTVVVDGCKYPCMCNYFR